MRRVILQFGFTLAEILIALFIFAILGTLSVLILHSVINTHVHLNKSTTQWQQLQSALILMQRDITQAVNRPVRDKSGVLRAAFNASQIEVALTTLNNINPDQLQKRSNLARVAYVIKQGQLERLTWPVLDNFKPDAPQTRVLLNYVQDLQWQFIGAKAQSYTYWPANKNPLPRAVIVRFKLPRLGMISRVWVIPAAGGANVSG